MNIYMEEIKMKKLLIIIAVFILSVNSFASYRQDDIKEAKILKKSMNLYKASASSVTSFDLSAKMPNVMNQGNAPTCTSCTVGYYMNGYLQGREQNWFTKGSRFSANFLFNEIANYKQIDWGSSFQDNMNILLNDGGCQYGYMPYSENTTKQRSASAIKDAQNFKISQYGVVSNIPYDYMAFKNWLINCQSPIGIGIPVSEDFVNLNANNQIYNKFSTSTNLGLHAITIVGFDDSKNAFKFVNSWGTDWGLSGYGWIDYNLVFPEYSVYGFAMVDDVSTLKPKYDEYKLKKFTQSNNYVGSDWKFYFNSKLIKIGGKYYTSNSSIKIKVVEDDPTYDDVGSITKTLNYGTNTISITVKENGGKYKGKTCKVTLTIVRL